MGKELCDLSISELAPLIQSRKISPVDLTNQVLSRIEALQPKLNSFITVTARDAREAARAAEKEILAEHYRGPLHGIPISIKDLFATRGVRTTAGSKILSNWVPDFDATPVATLRAAGAILVGKTNMHEFAYGVTNDNPHYGPARNPWDPQLIPGGSSGGSGAAVASSQCIASLGSDTGGSIRIPAAVCGVVGLKPTYGRVSRFGTIPLSWSLDHAGPIAKTVEDAAILLGVIAGHDPKDTSTSHRAVPDYRGALKDGLSGMKIGVPKGYFFDHLDREILQAVKTAIAKLAESGADILEVSIPHLENCAAMEAHINLAEATSYHEKYLKSRPGDYGPGVRTDLEAGRYLLATDYVKSQRARTLLQRHFRSVFEAADIIVSPTLPAFPPKIGEVHVQSGDLREHIIDAFLRFNIPYDLTGLPAVSLPCGFSSHGLPIGLQMAGPAFEEIKVLRAAHAYEQASEWHLRHLSLKT